MEHEYTRLVVCLCALCVCVSPSSLPAVGALCSLPALHHVTEELISPGCIIDCSVSLSLLRSSLISLSRLDLSSHHLPPPFFNASSTCSTCSPFSSCHFFFLRGGGVCSRHQPSFPPPHLTFSCLIFLLCKFWHANLITSFS